MPKKEKMIPVSHGPCGVSRSQRQFLDSLIEFISDSSDQSTEEIVTELRQGGLKIDLLIERIKGLVKKHLSKEVLNES